MKVNHGPCVVCGKPVLYLGCKYCGPECNFSVLEMEDLAGPPDEEAEESDGPPESQERPADKQETSVPKRRLYL